MPPKNNSRTWNDIQTAIATVAIVTTLGMWNLFAKPVQKTNPMPPQEASLPTQMPQVKIFFTTQPASQPVTAQQPQTSTRKNKNKGGGTVTTTKTS